MIPLIPFLVDTAIAYEEPDLLNYVHEWGVVVFEDRMTILCGGPWPENDYPYDMCAEAPVVWIHGEPFEGSFSVRLPEEQYFTFMYPEPSSVSGSAIEWSFSAGIPPSVEESLPPWEQSMYYGPFSWALESWRSVPSLPLFMQATGVEESFLYYECTVSADFADHFFTGWNDGNPVLAQDAFSEALLFTPDGFFPLNPAPGEIRPLALPVRGETDPALAMEIFCRWAGSALKSEEIQALWDTWEPEWADGESVWLVFPIATAYHDEISVISLEKASSTGTAYERFFLGAVRLRQL